MKVYGDTNSGNCLKVKWVCDHLALPYTWIAVDTLKGETRTAEFLKLNGAGQVPTIELDDGRTLAQSNAIIRYLARGSHLIPQDAFAEGRWTSGCSGNSTATSLISPSAASRCSI
jgi:glutathione S-transferase